MLEQVFWINVKASRSAARGSIVKDYMVRLMDADLDQRGWLHKALTHYSAKSKTRPPSIECAREVQQSIMMLSQSGYCLVTVQHRPDVYQARTNKTYMA